MLYEACNGAKWEPKYREGLCKGVCVRGCVRWCKGAAVLVWMVCPECHLLAASGWLVDSDLDKWAGITLNADRDLEATEHCNHAHMTHRCTHVLNLH